MCDLRKLLGGLRTALVVCLCLSLFASPALAAKHTATRKAGRGLAALTTGFLEIPGTMAEVGAEKGPVWGMTLGLTLGLGKMVPRYLVGAYELLTAPLETPPGYKPILTPEFAWDYFD